MTGTFEIDVFNEKDYYLLGSKKKAQLEQTLGYKHIEDSNQNVYCIHIHSVCFMGMLSTAEIEKTLKKMNGISVHFQELDDLKSRDSSIRTILRYGAKVCFSRRLANGKSLKWNNSQLKEYMNVIYKERGRSSMKCFISPVEIRSKKSVIKSISSNSVSTL